MSWGFKNDFQNYPDLKLVIGGILENGFEATLDL